MRRFKSIFILILLAMLPLLAVAQPSGFLDHVRVGFGAGLNTAHIIDLAPFNIFEDLSGQEYENIYSGTLQNIGNQYFVQLEYYDKDFIISLKPGTYSYRFSKLNEILFSTETAELETPYLLRYVTVPLEGRYNLDLKRYRPYAGLSLAYSHLLSSNDASNQTFIRPRFSAGAVVGSYIDLRSVILDLNLGYHSSLHNIANKADRFGTGNGSSFAQDDILLNELQLSISLLFSLQKQRRFSNVECYY